MIRVVNGKLAVFIENPSEGEFLYDTVDSLIGLLQAANEDMLTHRDIYNVAELLREFTPTIDQWQLIFDNEKKVTTQKSNSDIKHPCDE